jgi:Spy/CpxP family protein refolding chaperone
MKCIVNLFVLTLLSAVVAPYAVADEPAQAEKPAQRQAGGRNQGAVPPFGALRSIELTSDQKAKVDALRKEHAPKIRDLNKKLGMTPELRQKLNAVNKEETRCFVGRRTGGGLRDHRVALA